MSSQRTEGAAATVLRRGKKKAGESQAGVESDFSGLLRHREAEEVRWRPRSVEQRRVMNRIAKRREEVLRARRLVGRAKRKAGGGRNPPPPSPSPPREGQEEKEEEKREEEEGEGGVPEGFSTQHHRKRAAEGCDSLTAPQCPGAHPLVRTRGLPARYAAQRGYSIRCDACSRTGLQADPSFWHCAECRYDCCGLCRIGRRRRHPQPPTPPPPEGEVLPAHAMGAPSAPSAADAEQRRPAKYRLGDEVELFSSSSSALGLGLRGVVTGFHRGRVGVDLFEQRRGVLPSSLRLPGEGTRHSSYHPADYPVGTLVEVCGTGTAADGRRGRVSGGLTRDPSTGEPSVDVDVYPDALSLRQNMHSKRYCLPVANLTLPVGVGVHVKASGDSQLDGRTGRISGYARGRVGVRMKGGKVVGLPPGCVIPGEGEEEEETPPETPPKPPSPPPPPPAEPQVPKQAVRNLLNTLRQALVHSCGPAAFVLLRKAVAKFPPNLLGLKLVLSQLGLGEVAADDATLNTIFKVFRLPGTEVLDREGMVTALRRRTSDRRERCITKIFSALDLQNAGRLPVAVLKKQFVNHTGPMAPEHFFDSSRKEITQAYFAEFYRDLSAAIASDNHFQTILTSSWKVAV